MLSETIEQWTHDWEQKGFEKGLEQGIEQGIERGIIQGLEKSRRELVTNAYLAGIPVAAIAEFSRLTIGEVEAIIGQLRQN